MVSTGYLLLVSTGFPLVSTNTKIDTIGCPLLSDIVRIMKDWKPRSIQLSAWNVWCCPILSAFVCYFEKDWWRKGRDSNPRYGRAVYRISSPAHSTSLPPFRAIGAEDFIRMQINLLLAFSAIDKTHWIFSTFYVAHQQQPLRPTR